MYECDSTPRSECAFCIRATWCAPRALSRGERESTGFAQVSWTVWEPSPCPASLWRLMCLQELSKSKDLPPTGSKAQWFGSSWQCRCCCFCPSPHGHPPLWQVADFWAEAELPLLNACSPWAASCFSKSRQPLCPLRWERDTVACATAVPPQEPAISAAKQSPS